MSLSVSTLNAIQKVGAAAFTADEKLKKEASHYAERVHAAITNNPYNLGNDNLIENWKVVARLSQTLAGIEEELKKVYQVAAELTGDDQPSVRDMPALAAPARSTGKAARRQAMTSAAVKADVKKKAFKPAKVAKAAKAVNPVEATPKSSGSRSALSPLDLAPTDVRVKPSKKAAAPKAAKVPKAPKTKETKAAVSGAPEKTSKPGGNPAKLLAYLQGTLNANEFSPISQTAVGKATGIALGSMTAAIKKLVESGRIIAGPTGSYKLADSGPTVAVQ